MRKKDRRRQGRHAGDPRECRSFDGRTGRGFLEKPIDWLFGWKASFERVRQRFGLPVAVLLTLSVAGGLVWWNWDEIAKRPGVEFNSRALQPKSAPHRAGRASHHRGLANSRATKTGSTKGWCATGCGSSRGGGGVCKGRSQAVDPDQPDEKKSRRRSARPAPRQTGADVLVWGGVISLSGKTAMRLYWTPARDVSGAKSTGKYQPQTETLALPVEFWSDLKQIFGLLVQSRIAALTSDQPGHYVAEKLAPLIAQVRALVREQGRRLESRNPGRRAVQFG